MARTNTGRQRRKGEISAAEFNKHLQANGFQCSRTRIKSITRYASPFSSVSCEEPFETNRDDLVHNSSAGNWLFCHRRWLDPRIPEELQILDRNYDGLCATFPGFASCSKANFLQILTDVCASWPTRLGNGEAGPLLPTSDPSDQAPVHLMSRFALWTVPIFFSLRTLISLNLSRRATQVLFPVETNLNRRAKLSSGVPMLNLKPRVTPIKHKAETTA